MDIYSIKKKNVIWILVYYKFYCICYINYFSLIIKIIQLLIYYFIVVTPIIFIVISLCKSFVIKFVAVLAFFLTIYIYIYIYIYKLIFHISQKNYHVNVIKLSNLYLLQFIRIK